LVGPRVFASESDFQLTTDGKEPWPRIPRSNQTDLRRASS
jgi:hypothetical protein